VKLSFVNIEKDNEYIVMMRQYLNLLKLKRSKFAENFAALFSFTSFAGNIQL